MNCNVREIDNTMNFFGKIQLREERITSQYVLQTSGEETGETSRERLID